MPKRRREDCVIVFAFDGFREVIYLSLLWCHNNTYLLIYLLLIYCPTSCWFLCSFKLHSFWDWLSVHVGSLVSDGQNYSRTDSVLPHSSRRCPALFPRAVVKGILMARRRNVWGCCESYRVLILTIYLSQIIIN